MKVQKNKVVALSYCLQVEGKIADQAGADAPLEYIHGTGMLLPKFEANVDGKEPGETFEFTLSPEEGYGVYNDAYKVDLPKSTFEIDGKLREDLLRIGNVLPLLNSEGQVIQGTVAAIGDTTVTMDFNHPMAGKTLNFSGKVESVRDATEKELLEGLHGEYLPHDCECGGKCHNGEGGCHKGECHKGEGECHKEEGHKCHCHHEE